jgi:hypothetical protein
MRMAHFYLTLPSNSSMKYYPTNTLTRYTTRLENAISLSGDWEVGLFEIQYTHSWFNLRRGEGRITYEHWPASKSGPIRMQGSLRVLTGYYDTAVEIVEAVNNAIREYANKHKLLNYPVFNYNPIRKRVHTLVGRQMSLHFSPTLCNMLGIDQQQNPIVSDGDYALRFNGDNACDVNSGFSSAYVYCNVLEHIPVGDTKAPLLRIVSLSGKSGDTIHKIYEKPIYVPLQQKSFDSIEIDMRSDIGDPIPFEYGKVLVTLHFRQRKIPYLLQ